MNVLLPTALNHVLTPMEVSTVNVELGTHYPMTTELVMVSYNCQYLQQYFLFQCNTTLDINECQIAINNCSELCINTNGSFYCQCTTGYLLSTDNKTCNG